MAKSKISYTWVIQALDAKISQDSKDNVIYNVHWGYNANKGDYNSNIYGTYGVVYDKDNFIEYDKLKKSDVIKWLEAGLDVDSMKSSLSGRIDKQENPTDVSLKPSW